ncbi:hypothetical protein ACFVW5_27730, partial [Streptomyces sp. NPDC058232]|uniref:hypothetical protein n=1 Tax=Streptomyces sp. NPDC058232 TaxID=3346393 RepID=UPI0036F17054
PQIFVLVVGAEPGRHAAILTHDLDQRDRGTPPTWWKANRYKVFLVLGLIGGFYLGTHTVPVDPSTDSTVELPPRPTPSH